MFFVLSVLNFFFINSTKHVFLFLRTKTVFQNSVPKHNFFLKKHQKLFSKIIFQKNFQKQQPNRPLYSTCNAYEHVKSPIK